MFSLLTLSRSTTLSLSGLCSLLPGAPAAGLGAFGLFARTRTQLAPRQVKHIKRHKGRVPIPIGGSIKGTTLAYGEWGLRIKGMGARLTAKQLTTAEEVIKRKIKIVKGAKVYIRVFPDIPVCIKVRFSVLLYSCNWGLIGDCRELGK